jgi:chromosome segregation ATPase
MENSILLGVDATDKATADKIEKLRAEREKTDAALAEAESELGQLEHKLARLKQSQSAAERKARARRLIERGAIAESFIPNAPSLTNEEFKSALVRAFRGSE